eukprot:747996-Hanusia_phi.AAC.2
MRQRRLGCRGMRRGQHDRHGSSSSTILRELKCEISGSRRERQGATAGAKADGTMANVRSMAALWRWDRKRGESITSEE